MVGEVLHVQGQEAYRNSILSTQLFCKTKPVLKSKVYYLKIIQLKERFTSYKLEFLLLCNHSDWNKLEKKRETEIPSQYYHAQIIFWRSNNHLLYSFFVVLVMKQSFLIYLFWKAINFLCNYGLIIAQIILSLILYLNLIILCIFWLQSPHH